MSELGQRRRFDPLPATSGLPRSTDINRPAQLDRLVPCVYGSGLARIFFTFAALVGAAMCSAFKLAASAERYDRVPGVRATNGATRRKPRCNQAWWQLLEERQDRAPLQLAADHHRAGRRIEPSYEMPHQGLGPSTLRWAAGIMGKQSDPHPSPFRVNRVGLTIGLSLPVYPN
jgi:hypothetical protein